MTVDDLPTNPTFNRSFAEVPNARMSRRTMIGSLATAAVAFSGSSGIVAAAKGGQPGHNVAQPGPGGLLVVEPFTGEIRRLFAGVAGDEITGIAITPDRRTMFINTQHHGNGDPALTNCPVVNDAADPAGPIPRDATFVITRKDGGIVGSSPSPGDLS